MGTQCCTNESIKKEASLNISIASGPEMKKASREGKKEEEDSSSRGEGRLERKTKSKAKGKIRNISMERNPAKSEPPARIHAKMYQAPVAKIESDKTEIYHVHEVLEFNPKTAMMKGRGYTTKLNRDSESPAAIRYGIPTTLRPEQNTTPPK